MRLLDIPGPSKRVKPLVAIAVLTRNRPEMLAAVLRQIADARKTTQCVSYLMVWNNGEGAVPGQTHGVGHNVGQHVSMNRMIDEAMQAGADYFLRIDDDCVFQSRNWLAKLVRLAERHKTIYGQPCVIAPFVHGLRFPPKAMGDVTISGKRCQVVPILGGICRLMPMSHLRYWRFDERMPMGWSEASSYARYCILTKMPMLRCVNIEVAHGDPDIGSIDTAVEYEREMLKMTPYEL